MDTSTFCDSTSTSALVKLGLRLLTCAPPVFAFRFDMILISLKLISRCCGVCGWCTRLFRPFPFAKKLSKDVCFLLIFASLLVYFLSNVSRDRDKRLDVSSGTGECYIGENPIGFQ